MVEVLAFIFASFWRYLGFLILVVTVASSLNGMFVRRVTLEKE